MKLIKKNYVKQFIVVPAYCKALFLSKEIPKHNLQEESQNLQSQAIEESMLVQFQFSPVTAHLQL